jgi:hypothetical protein
LAKRCGPVNTGCFGDIKRSVPRAHERAYPTDHDDSRCRCRDTCPRLTRIPELGLFRADR